jgi:hypothetical protein
MTRLLTWCRASLLPGSGPARRRRPHRPAVEQLEGRRLLSTTITFNEAGTTAGMVLTDRYASQGEGVVFTNAYGAALPVLEVGGFDALLHKTYLVADITGQGEFVWPHAVGQFAKPRQHVQVSVGEFASPYGLPDTAHVTLTAWDSNHHVVAQSSPVAVTAGAGFGTVVAVDAPAATIAEFQVAAAANLDADKRIGLGSLTFSDPPPVLVPDFRVSAAAPAVRVAPGGATPVADPVTIAGLNNATGRVQLALAGFPAGVTATFSPDPVAVGGTSVLSLRAAPGTALTGGQALNLTLTATPLDAGAGTTTHTLPLGLYLRPDFTVGVGGTTDVGLPPCTAVPVTVDVSREVGFTDPVTLGVTGLPSGVRAVFSTNPVGVDQAGDLTSTTALTLTGEGTAIDAHVSVTATDGAQTGQVVLHLHSIPGHVDRITPLNNYDAITGHLRTPVAWDRQPGSEVLVEGTGFCPGSTVQFGNPDAKTTPTSIAADGRSLHVTVPSLATDGPLTVLPPPGMGGPIVSADQVRVDSFRNTDGFRFPNFIVDNATGVGDYTTADAAELFGEAQLEVWGIHNYVADGVLAAANAALRGDGHCFGFSLASQRFTHDDESLAGYPWHGSPADTWALDGPTVDTSKKLLAGVNDAQKLVHYIHLLHLAQISSQFVAAYKDDYLHHLTANADDVYNEVAHALKSGDGPLISLREDLGAGHFHGHVLVAYDLEEDGTQGNYYIDVYDPNVPFLPPSASDRGENDPTLVDGSGQLQHTLRTNASRIHVFADGHWEFPLLRVDGQSTGNWASGLDGLIVVPYSQVPVALDAPWTLTGFLNTVFGDAGEVTQVGDAAGHTLLRPDGTVNKDPATRLPGAAPFGPLDSEASAGMYVLDDHGAYTETVHGTGTGNYTAEFFGDRAAVRLDTTGSPGNDDQVTLDAQALAVRFHTAAASKPVTLQLSARAADGSARTYVITTTAYRAGDDRFDFDAARQSLTYTHAGPAADVTVTMTGVDAQGKPISLSTPALHVAGCDTLVLPTSGWQQVPAPLPPPAGDAAGVPSAPQPGPAPTPPAPHRRRRRARKHRGAAHGHKRHQAAKAARAERLPAGLSAAAVDQVFADPVPAGAAPSRHRRARHAGRHAVPPFQDFAGWAPGQLSGMPADPGPAR